MKNFRANSKIDERILILTPTGADREIACRLLSEAGLETEPCYTIPDLNSALSVGAGVALVAQEALASEDIHHLIKNLESQPPWSDISLIVLTAGEEPGYAMERLSELLGSIGNIVLLERPFKAATLISTVQTALRARRRQYEVRNLLTSERAAREEQVVATKALTESEERLQLILSNVQDHAIFTLSCAGVVTSWNVGAERVFQFSEAEIIGKNGEILFTPEDRQANRPQVEMSKAADTGSSEDARWHVRRDGSKFFASGSMEGLRDKNGNLHGFVKVVRDITKQREFHIERDQLLESERTARMEAERIGRMKDEFLATLSHELRTPLNAILGWTQLLRKGDKYGAELPRGLEVIERNTRLQSKLIEDLLDMSSIISGKVRLEIQRADIVDILDSAIATALPTANAKDVKLIKYTELKSEYLFCDAGRLQQVIWNLLSNAIKFTPIGGEIRVALDHVGSQIELTVTDTGRGIKPEFLPFVFERFRQEDASTTRKFGGLGIGLSLVKNLTEMHGGTVSVSSEGDGKGTTFTVSLPVHSEIYHSTESKNLSINGINTEPTYFDTPHLMDLHVLVVDDDEDAREVVRRIVLESGAKVSVASSAIEALAKIKSEKPDVLVSDIGMPEMDGYELMRRIRQLPAEQRGTIPSIALTAFARTQDRTLALGVGYQAHLAKPVDPTELLHLIKRIAECDEAQTELSA